MKTILTTVFLILIQHLSFSQKPNIINITATDSSKISVMNLRNSDISLDSIYNSDTMLTSMGYDDISIVYDLKEMTGCLYGVDEIICDHIVSYEFISDNVVHIVMDELNVKYPAKDNVRITTHRYIDFKNKITTYKWTWDIDNIKSHRAVVTNNVLANIQND